MNTEEPLDMGAFRARREAATRERKRRRELEHRDVAAYIDDVIRRCQSMQASEKAAEILAERAERDRLDGRRQRLRVAGADRPRDGTPQAAAWDRVVRARSADEAAMPGHSGSALAMTAIERWQRPGVRKTTVALLGDPGTGKTVAAWFAIANEGGLFVPADEIAPTPAWNELHPRAQRAGLLVLNDLHERMTAWAWAAVEALVVHRHDYGRRTLVAANLSPAVLFDRLGDRVASRIGQPGDPDAQGRIVVIGGPDMRSGSWRRQQ